MKRRQFLNKGAAGLASVGLLAHLPQSLSAMAGRKAVRMPIGFQSFVVKKEIAENLEGTLKRLQGYGYEQVEMCSPSGYVKYGFEPLAKYSGQELKRIIADSGLDCVSCHFTMEEMKNNLDDRIDFAQQMGLRHMVFSGGLSTDKADELKSRCETVNQIGEKIKKAGMVTGYHNHNSEFDMKIDGAPVYDMILKELDPDLVKMQFQTAAIRSGYKAADYFKKYPGRFISAHLQDYSPQDNTKEVVLGQGISDWREFFAAGKKAGLQLVFVEMESNPGTLKNSVTYLKNL
ncbi:sugar phosphate isomerase/epimerase family protein [Persicitalea jodogahamensis]|uniref:sugar phosphate isomerase/epimerase family protein n=1 Tax=Persicitalea jodogahamensis TaxID=402147 RepID=UPI001676EA3A|nr:sugar phosphate isomerase/epimerase [Persicitalea jodogahamensis]